MGGVRVTQGMLVERVLFNLQNQTQRLLQLQNQLSTGLRVNRPSDDPIDARRAIDVRTTIEKDEQFLDNIRTVSPQLLESASTIQTAIDAMQRAREITIQGANGTVQQPELDQIANEMNQILESVFDSANHKTDNKFIFAGTRTQGQAFSATRDANDEIVSVTYEGNDENIEVAVSEDVTTVINVTGSDVFLLNQDVFQLLIDVRDDLRGGDQSALQNQRLGEFDTVQDQLLLAMARIGATQNRLDRTNADLQDFIIQLQLVLSETVEADYAEVVVSLNAQSNAYEAALSAAARVIQPSLLDFIR